MLERNYGDELPSFTSEEFVNFVNTLVIAYFNAGVESEHLHEYKGAIYYYTKAKHTAEANLG